MVHDYYFAFPTIKYNMYFLPICLLYHYLIKVLRCVTKYFMLNIFSNTVNCLQLSSPQNGMINCLLINASSFSHEDTCSFTCNTGYELTGSDSRACQSDGSWSGYETMCRRGMVI